MQDFFWQNFMLSFLYEDKNRVCIFIDAGNLYHLVLKKININNLEFDFEGLAQWLVNNRTLVDNGKRYYSGSVREKTNDLKSKQALAKQNKLFTQLKKQGWEIKTSKLRFRKEKIIIDQRVTDYKRLLKKGIKEIEYERWREKGIDVKLATDLIVGAVDNKYDTAIVVSSDSDLVPAIDWIRKRKKRRVEYIGFSIADLANKNNPTRPSQTIISYSDIQRVLIVTDIKKFIKSS